jgi:hypothetical protein
MITRASDRSFQSPAMETDSGEGPSADLEMLFEAQKHQRKTGGSFAIPGSARERSRRFEDRESPKLLSCALPSLPTFL